MNRRGFTLIELIVGLSVAAIALAAALGALTFVSERAKEAESATVVALEGATAREMLVDWLSGARAQAPGRAGAFQGIEAEENGVPSDTIVFPTTAETPLQVRNSVVRLYIDRNDTTAEQGLVADLWERRQDLPRRVQLVPEAAELQIRYLPAVAEATEWLDGWTGGNNGLPLAVELVLTPVRGDSLPVLLRFPLRVALGALR
jgi:prepilin-type N-terminal cleavage/methylation domain-containing protein